MGKLWWSLGVYKQPQQSYSPTCNQVFTLLPISAVSPELWRVGGWGRSLLSFMARAKEISPEATPDLREWQKTLGSQYIVLRIHWTP
jgi:hypothetical protein